MESDAVALRVGSGLQFTLRRLATLAYGIAVVAAELMPDEVRPSDADSAVIWFCRSLMSLNPPSSSAFAKS